MRFLAWSTVAATSATLLYVVPPAHAACSWVQTEEMVSGVIRIKWEQRCPGSESTAATSSSGELPPRDSDWDSPCVRDAIELGADPSTYCDVPTEPATDTQTLTPGRVSAAFRELPLPPAELVIQPPGGRTLVNLDTNFYTEQGEFTRTITLLGRQVELRIRPVRFRWSFGDGETRETTTPGSAYPDLEITHSYRERGRVSPSVDTTYAARFRVGAGAWQDLPGTATVPGAPQPLRVVTARPALVGGGP